MNVLANSFNSYLQAKWLRLSKKTIPGKEMMLLPGIFFEDDWIISRRCLLHLSNYQLQL